MASKPSRPHVPYSVEFGAYLKDKRLSKDMSQADLSRALGYDTAQVVSNWERGIQAPPFEKLLELCKLLNIARKDILKRLLDEQARVYEDSLKQLWNDSGRSRKGA